MNLGRRAAAIFVMAFFFGAPAASGTEEEFGDLLEVGRTHDALALAETWVRVEDSQKAKFALGTAQFLYAIERLGNGLHAFGLGNAVSTGMWMDLADLPFLRVPVPPNPDPQPVTYEGLRDVLQRFGDDLSLADMTLAGIGTEEFDYALDIGALSLDLDGDGQVGPEENLVNLFSAVSQMRPPARGLKFDFDQSDAPWLRGYTHLLRAMTEFLLAHDWRQTFDETFHFLFPDSKLKSSEIRSSAADAMIFLEQHAPPIGYWEATRSYDWNDPNKPSRESWASTPKGREWAKWNREYGSEYRRAENFLEYGGIADIIAFIHRFDWPIVDEGRMANSRIHLLTMIDLSRENWRRILQESDDKYEWLPSPKQTPRFPRMRVNQQVVEGWHGFLDTAEDVLEGRKLIAHWRFLDKGVNVRRMFEDPGTFDPVMIAQGATVIPYLEEGEMVSAQTAETMIDIFERGFFAYFVWFN
ncbi:hypothetical protein [Sulfitobacter sp. SK011]|uniref:hypothetical protein n=1 Tax=Sulfitobacter sp. SK011 TaxID=1389004 RepID=UPI000E0B79CE|nr:hypothetical protein [Sulfitobacter sp. SK011]AXI43441.1 hypothetical protein C1J02_17020 [Sulfitobacter sp. SK011]